ncbi:hypothetical protein JGY85_25455 (plasmid) [Shigella sonnei]|nr:hypothetical protein [Shigella sonnei]
MGSSSTTRDEVGAGFTRAKLALAVNALGFSASFRVFAALKRDAEHTPARSTWFAPSAFAFGGCVKAGAG